MSKEYQADRSTFLRPFYPGGDYENYNYEGGIVVDNPPFSIITKIVNFYVAKGIRFFLFAPGLTSIIQLSDICTTLIADAKITYENGAIVSTSFVTNLDDENIRIRTVP